MVFQIWDNDKFSFDDFLGEHHFQSTILPISVSQSPCCACVSRAFRQGWQEDHGAHSHWSLVLSEAGDTGRRHGDRSGQQGGLAAEVALNGGLWWMVGPQEGREGSAG